jgi:S1-C subfamily serine protease
MALLWQSPVVAADFSADGSCHPASSDNQIAMATRAVVRISGDRRGPSFFANPVFGSGIVVSADGLVVTSAHVVIGAANLTISGPGLPPVASTTVLVDPSTDVALLRLASGTPSCLAPSNRPTQVGDTVFAIGFPFGASKATIAKGSLTALPPPQTEIASVVGLLRVDAAIAPGDSGGALVSADGALIGVITAKYREAGAAGEPGFAVPAGVVRRLIARAAAAQTDSQPIPPLTRLDGREPVSGAAVTTLTPALASRYGVDPAVTGALIWDVGRGYAAQSGFTAGDVVTRVNDRPVATANDLAALLASASNWRITVRRGDNDLTSAYGDVARGR